MFLADAGLVSMGVVAWVNRLTNEVLPGLVIALLAVSHQHQHAVLGTAHGPAQIKVETLEHLPKRLLGLDFIFLI
jgi:hypothetical protein